MSESLLILRQTQFAGAIFTCDYESFNKVAFSGYTARSATRISQCHWTKLFKGQPAVLRTDVYRVASTSWVRTIMEFTDWSIEIRLCISERRGLWTGETWPV